MIVHAHDQERIEGLFSFHPSQPPTDDRGGQDNILPNVSSTKMSNSRHMSLDSPLLGHRRRGTSPVRQTPADITVADRAR